MRKGLLKEDDNVFTCKEKTEYKNINKRNEKKNRNIGSLFAVDRSTMPRPNTLQAT